MEDAKGKERKSTSRKFPLLGYFTNFGKFMNKLGRNLNKSHILRAGLHYGGEVHRS